MKLGGVENYSHYIKNYFMALLPFKQHICNSKASLAVSFISSTVMNWEVLCNIVTKL